MKSNLLTQNKKQCNVAPCNDDLCYFPLKVQASTWLLCAAIVNMMVSGCGVVDCFKLAPMTAALEVKWTAAH